MPQSKVALAASFVRLSNNRITTTSTLLARAFGKRHDNVVRAIDKLECSDEFRSLNFEESSKTVEMPNGGARVYREFELTRDGFVFLAMGFTGKEVAQWKEAYINAFNDMEAELSRQQQPKQAAALPVISQPDLETINRINQRVWNLAQASFEEYRSRMMEDVLVKNGSTKPEDWEPVETSAEMIEMILATVNGLESMTRSLRRKAGRLEAATNHGKVVPQGGSGLQNNLHKRPK